MELTLPEANTEVAPKSEWIVILGGSGTVGQFAIQVINYVAPDLQ